MKKILLLGATAIMCFASCPDLTKENQNKKEAEQIANDLKTSFPNLYNLYSETISVANNNTNDTEKYMSVNGLQEFGRSLVWGSLLPVFYVNDKTSKEENDIIKKRIFSAIDFKSQDWCEKLDQTKLKGE